MNKISFKKNDILPFLILLVVFFINIPIPFFRVRLGMEKIYLILSIICILIAIIHFRKISWMFCFITGFFIISYLATYLNDGYGKRFVITSYIRTFNLIIVAEYYIKRNPKVFLFSGTLFFSIILIINIITILLYPNGLYKVNNINPHYFLGHRNDTIEYILPMITFLYVYKIVNDNKSQVFVNVMTLIGVFSVILTWSANAIVAMFFVVLYIWLPTKKVLQPVINYLHTFLVSVGITLAFAVFNLQRIFGWFITGILHKDITFTSRSDIWERALYYIKKSKIIGYGYERDSIKLFKIGHVSSCHNYFFDFLYSGGIVLLIDVLAIVYLAGKKIMKKFNNDKITKIQKIFTGVFGGYFLIWFATPVHLNTIGYMFLIFTMAYYVESFINVRKEE